MKTRLTNIPVFVNGMSLRERSIFVVATVLILAGISYQFLIDPVQQGNVVREKERATWMQETTDAKQRLFAAQAKATAAQGGVTTDTLETQIKERKTAIDATTLNNASLSSSDVLASAKTLVKSYPQVTLKEMAVQASQAIALGEGAEKIVIQSHDMLLTVEGSYLDLLAYLQSLEKGLPGIRWSALTVEQKKDLSTTRLTVKLTHVQLPSDVLKAKP